MNYSVSETTLSRCDYDVVDSVGKQVYFIPQTPQIMALGGARLSYRMSGITWSFHAVSCPTRSAFVAEFTQAITTPGHHTNQ